MRKKLLLSLSVFLMLFTLAACGNGDEEAEDTPDDELREFTLEELSQYDGEDGADAYVAVDGYVYDMTDSAQWTEGSHQGQVQAGQDLTEEIDNNDRHGREMLDRVPRIGILVESSDEETSDNENANGGY